MTMMTTVTTTMIVPPWRTNVAAFVVLVVVLFAVAVAAEEMSIRDILHPPPDTQSVFHISVLIGYAPVASMTHPEDYDAWEYSTAPTSDPDGMFVQP